MEYRQKSYVYTEKIHDSGIFHSIPLESLA